MLLILFKRDKHCHLLSFIKIFSRGEKIIACVCEAKIIWPHGNFIYEQCKQFLQGT
jgi:hypothetical protein